MVRMPDYTYSILKKGGVAFILIVDQNLGGLSVTNGIEEVVDEISMKEKIKDLNKFVVLYKDSEGIWDGWSNENQEFFGFDIDCRGDEEVAMGMYLLSRQLEAVTR